jgi:hypothetical protein
MQFFRVGCMKLLYGLFRRSICLANSFVMAVAEGKAPLIMAETGSSRIRGISDPTKMAPKMPVAENALTKPPTKPGRLLLSFPYNKTLTCAAD